MKKVQPSISILDRFHRQISENAVASESFKSAVVKFANLIGYDLRHLARAVYQDECLSWIQELGPESLDVLEVSAGPTWRDVPFRSYTEMNFPTHDICKETISGQFDLIIADQVFEHLLWPYRAGRNVFSMLRPGGYFLVMTPFLIRVHEIPVDCSRWTETGLRYFLAECGFDLNDIRTSSWGNRKAVKKNFVNWGRIGWRKKLPNESDYPISVWALARKPQVDAKAELETDPVAE